MNEVEGLPCPLTQALLLGQSPTPSQAFSAQMSLGLQPQNRTSAGQLCIGLELESETMGFPGTLGS